MDRAITQHEASVIAWLIDNAAFVEPAPYRAQPIEELRVSKWCDCGCASLDFRPQRASGARIIADALAIYPDGQEAGLILWGHEDTIAFLEIYDCHPGASHRFPELADLRTWEQRGDIAGVIVISSRTCSLNSDR